MNWRWRFLALIIGATFIYAGVLKAFSPLRFANDIDNYHLMPWAISVRLAFYLPWLEIFCGADLLARIFYRGALLILLALVFVFISASVVAKVRGIDITCGCFGTAAHGLNFGWHLVLDLVILAGLLVLSRKTPTPASKRS